MSGSDIEILAPAGSQEALTAAVRCGADAVYLGAGTFNARRGAENFTPEALAAAVAYCHGRGVRIYLTLNTLIRDSELEAAMRLAAFACEAGMDALILQDLGLARRIREAAPDMPLHASTQLSCHTPAGVRFLSDAGFSRVVLAREMTGAEIISCKNQGAELEMFVHGALCMSVSGQCMLSAVLGGSDGRRSGNRGLCAQPCRLPFAAKNPAADKNSAALSLRDLSLLEHAEELSSLGVKSFKIEGRMKRPEYVAAAVRCYSAALRGEPLPDNAVEELSAVFSRGGFTDGYYTGKRTNMSGVRGAEDVRAAEPVLGKIIRSYASQTPRVPVSMLLRVRAEKPSALIVSDGSHSAQVCGEVPRPALSVELDAARAKIQLEKTGGTPFLIKDIYCEIEPGLSLPASALNALRRDALERLLELRSAFVPVEFSPAETPGPPCGAPIAGLYRKQGRARIIARLSSVRQLSESMDCDICVLPLSASAEELREALRRGETAVEVPRALFGREQDIRRRLVQAAELGISIAVCGNIGAVMPATDAGMSVLAGPGLHIFNRDSADFLALHGAGAVTASLELKFSQMNEILKGPLPAGIFAYGRLPLMLMRACPLRERGGSRCGACGTDGERALSDRMGIHFPVMCAGDGAASELLNSVPVYLADRLSDIPAVDFMYMYFTDEKPEDVSRILWEYRHGGMPPKAFTRGLYRHGVQ